MTAVFICTLALLISFIAGRRSVVAGLVSVLAFGYAYGITRANLPETFSHFIFDAAAFGLYLSQMIRKFSAAERPKFQALKAWLAVLVAWPLLLFLIPAQDPLVELVGLRGAVFLLPFILIGARLETDDLCKLSLWIAGLNIAAFSFAVAEFFLGVPLFYPKNPVTQIIYAGLVAGGGSDFRIPSTFTSSHAFAGTMVITIPLLVGTWQQKRSSRFHSYFLTAALAVSILGVFMAAARTHAVVLFMLVVVTTVSSRFNWVSRIGWVLMLVGIGWIVSGESRLQRFMSLQDTEAVNDRVAFSVNKGFFERAVEYPMGNGLGGGGTSLPYFLQGLVKDPVTIENEYARIMLELGIPGLCLWVAFMVWVLTRRTSDRLGPWSLGRRLMWVSCAAYFLTGLTGVGLFNSIPQTCVMLLSMGWISVRHTRAVAQPVMNASRTDALRTIGARQNA